MEVDVGNGTSVTFQPSIDRSRTVGKLDCSLEEIIADSGAIEIKAKADFLQQKKKAIKKEVEKLHTQMSVLKDVRKAKRTKMQSSQSSAAAKETGTSTKAKVGKKKKQKREGLMERMVKKSKKLKKDMDRMKFANAEKGEDKMYPVSMSDSNSSYSYTYSSGSEEADTPVSGAKVEPAKMEVDATTIPKAITASIGRQALIKVAELQKKIVADEVGVIELSNAGRELMMLASLETDCF